MRWPQDSRQGRNWISCGATYFPLFPLQDNLDPQKAYACMHACNHEMGTATSQPRLRGHQHNVIHFLPWFGLVNLLSLCVITQAKSSIAGPSRGSLAIVKNNTNIF